MAKKTSDDRDRAERFGWREGDLVPAGSNLFDRVGLAALRRSRGVTQVELAERLGMAQDQISKLEGRSDVKVSSLVRYLEGLGAGDVDVAISFEDGEHATLSLRRDED